MANTPTDSKHIHPEAHIVPNADSERITYIGIRDLTDDERMALEEVVGSYHDKVKRKARMPTSLTVHVKAHGNPPEGDPKKDKQRKYSLHVKLITAARTLEASSADFDIRKMTHVALEALLSEMEHQFHTDGGVAQKMMARDHKS